MKNSTDENKTGGLSHTKQKNNSDVLTNLHIKNTK